MIFKPETFNTGCTSLTRSLGNWPALDQGILCAIGGQNITFTKHLTQAFIKWSVSDVHNFNTPEQGNKYRKQWNQHTHPRLHCAWPKQMIFNINMQLRWHIKKAAKYKPKLWQKHAFGSVIIMEFFLSSLNCPGPWKMPYHGILDKRGKTCTLTCEN